MKNAHMTVVVATMPHRNNQSVRPCDWKIQPEVLARVWSKPATHRIWTAGQRVPTSRRRRLLYERGTENRESDNGGKHDNRDQSEGTKVDSLDLEATTLEM